MDSEQGNQPTGKPRGPKPSYDSAQYETAYRLYYIDGNSRRQISERMGLSEGQALHLARTHKRRLDAKSSKDKHG